MISIYRATNADLWSLVDLYILLNLINTTEQSSEALTTIFPNPNPKAWLNGLRFGCITRKLGMPPKMSAWRFGRNSSFLFSPHPTPARRAQEWRHVVPA